MDDDDASNKKVAANVNPSSYWLDACEDISISCDDLIIIPNFSNDFDATASSSGVLPAQPPLTAAAAEGLLDPCFFGGIDGILESIKKGAGLHPPPVAADRLDQSRQEQEEEILSSNIEDFGTVCENIETTTPKLNGSSLHDADNGNMTNERQPAELDNVNKSSSLDGGNKGSSPIHFRNGDGFLGHSESNHHRDYYSFDNSYPEDRYSKRPRLYHHDYKNEKPHHHFLGRGNNHYPNPRERKRPRDWEASDRRDRDRDQVWRRERGNGFVNGRKDCRDREWREVRGYWERDRSKGSSEMVFHTGSWEADRTREPKIPSDKNHDSNSTGGEKKAEEPKEKIQEEHARQYQLDVLQQAQNKNTIAFLETGAGKTLIAVLLIKSLYCQFQKLNKKFLAVFLVPKVPLVYQVINTTDKIKEAILPYRS